MISYPLKFLYRGHPFLSKVLSHSKSQLTRASSAKASTQQEEHYGPVELLKIKIEEGELLEDPHQSLVMKEIQKVYDAIQDYEPPRPNIFSKFFGYKKNIEAPMGLYLYGAVGGGKTMLMDLFYESCQVIISICLFYNIL